MVVTVLLDEFLPRYDVRTRHEVRVAATAARVYAAVRTMDLAESRMVRWLLLLRAVPQLLTSREARRRSRPLRLGLAELQQAGFVLLGEHTLREVVLGTVGRFWTPTGGTLYVDSGSFLSFDQAGYAKAAWNFSLSENNDGTIHLATETRVLCLDAWSRRWFRLYWLVVGPFSGLIRKQALLAIKRRAEQ